jgi:molybdopterin converting factor small subunit
VNQTKRSPEISGYFLNEESIGIKLQLESFLAKYAPDNPDNYLLPGGATLGDLLNHLGLGEDQVMLAFVNGRMATLQTRLADKDSVSLCPYICGG